MPKKAASKQQANKRQKEQSSQRARDGTRSTGGPEVIEDQGGDRESESDKFIIVGIGASAGGYEAFLQLLEHLPPDTGMGFVLVQHLDPKHESKLTELLERSTRMPVHQAKQGMTVVPNHIYVIPPNTDLALAGGHLRLQPRRNQRTPQMPIDFFFRSLAADRLDRTIGVILSGTGTDGTLGLQAIKGEGGITFAQDEKSSKYFGMPGSASAGGCVDFVLSPEGIARELERIARHPYVSKPPKFKPSLAAAETSGDKVFAGREDELNALFSLLRSHTGVDFSLYKHSTLRRRILRRMLLHRVDSLDGYLNHLRIHMVELDALFNDLLINVTSFFRDPHVIAALKRRVFPKLLRDRSPENPLRIWVCGCATGEEAYTMAMSVVEFLEGTQTHIGAQIFATDISEAGLEKARAGIYPASISQDVSPERLRRFFVKSNGHYQVSKPIRDMCVFARQNVIVDPPFSNIDLISCRNVMIYLGQVLQRKIMPFFHYALKPNGFLLLGASEALGSASDLFSIFDKKHKIYAKKPTPYRPGFPALEGKALTERYEVHITGVGAAKRETRAPDLQQYVDRLIMSRWSPAAVVINAQMDVLMFRGRTGNFLEHAPGSASLNLLKMAREGLTLDLRTIVSKAMKQDTPVRQEQMQLRHDEQTHRLSIEVVPFQLTPSSERYFLVLFQETQPPVPTPPNRERTGSAANRDRRELSKLRQELAHGKESLQSIIEEQEATNEELKSANEEIQSSNEELQSTNEELETAKEELQSTNEELTTLNEELQTRNLELSQVNNDLTNLLSSVSVAIIMLNNDLTIRRFTPMAERIFNLIPSDTGRRLSDLNRNIIVPDLDESIQQVVDDLATVEREVQDRAGHWYSLRIRPYRTRENRIDGAVILLVDIDEHKRAVEVIMSTIKHPLLSLDSDLRIKRANPAFYEMFKLKQQDTDSRVLYEVGNGELNIPRLRTALKDVVAKQQQVDDFELEAEFPGVGKRKLRMDAHVYPEDDRGGSLILLSIKDGVRE